MNTSWGFLDLPAMNDPEVVLRVQMGLSLTRPLVANYFHGALEGVLSLLGLKPPKPDEPQPQSQETTCRHYSRLLKQCLSQVSEGYQTDWEGQDGTEEGDLHLNYLADFSVRNPAAVHSVFDSTLIEDLLGPLSELNLEQTYTSKEPRSFKHKEDLWDAFGQISQPEQQYVADILASLVSRASNYLIGDGGEDGELPPPKNADIDVIPKPSGPKPGIADDPDSKAVPKVSDKTIPPPVPKAAPQVPDKSVQLPAPKQGETVPPQGQGSGLLKRKPDEQPQGAPLPKKAKTSGSAGASFMQIQGLTIPSDSSKSITAAFALQSQGGIDPDLRQRLGINPPKMVRVVRPAKDLPLGPEHPEKTCDEEPQDYETALNQAKPQSQGANLGSQQEKSKPLPGKGQKITPSLGAKSQKTTEAEKGVHPGTSRTQVSQGASGGGGADADEEDDEEDDDEEEEENGNAGMTQEERELKASERAMDGALYKAFTDDTELAQQVRNMMLGMDSHARLSRRDIKGDSHFDYIRAESVPKGSPVKDVSEYWEKLFSTKQLFATCLPSEVEVADDWETIYRTNDLIDLVPTAAGAWKSHDKKPRFVIVAHPSRTADQLKKKDFGITNFHEPASVKKISINFGGKGNRKQTAFCPYCGIHYENNDTALSHLCQHLNLEFLCGGCLTSRHHASGTLGQHQSHCGAIPALSKPRLRSTVKN